MKPIYWLDPFDPENRFPPVEEALDEPNGLLAAGGGLGIGRLLNAYRHGIFPWYEEGQPILWWSPEPRAVLFPHELIIRRSLRKRLRNNPYRVTFDTAFREVMTACAAPRAGQAGTWITPELVDAYCEMFAAGHTHSVELWDAQGSLVGGLYGVAIGRVFFGESMFSRVSDASKIGLVWLTRHLAAWGYRVIDCQQDTAHMLGMGARTIPRRTFSDLLNDWCPQNGHPAPWHVDPTLDVIEWRPETSITESP